MRKLIFLFLLLCCAYLCRAQKKLPAFGEVTLEDLQLKSCPFEADAPAMKLFEADETEFELYATGGSRLKTEHRTRIKIFNEKGFKHATIRIPYINKKSLYKIKELTAYVYNMDAEGKVVKEKLDKDDFFKEKVVGNLGTVSFTFPKLKAGSVVEYRYTRVENNVFQIDPWYIQDDIPTAYSSYIIITPPTSILKQKLFGQDKVELLPIGKKNSMLRYASWYKENIPSYKSEPYMTSKADNLMKMIFFHFPVNDPIVSTLSAPGIIWSFMGEYLLGESGFGNKVKEPISGTDKLLDSVKQLPSTAEKIHKIYNAVRNRFPGTEAQSMSVEDLGDAWKEQSASVAEINLLLINLLTKAKITCYPLLVSTREHGKVDKSFPSVAQLNGLVAIAMLDSTRFYVLDASIDHQSPDCPPLNILNREALLLRKGKIDWFLINDERPLYKQSINIFSEINKDGLMEGSASAQHYNYAKAELADSAKQKKEADDEFTHTKIEGLKIISSEKTLTEAEDDPLYENITFSYEPQQTNEFFFYNPNFLLHLPSNPFKAETRKTDIDFGCNQEMMATMSIAIPAGFEVDNLPKNVALMTADSSFFYKRTFSKEGQNIQITTIYRTGKSYFLPEEYEGIRDFFKQMDVYIKEEIVLIKKK